MDCDLLAVRFGYIYLIVYAGCTVKVEREVLETHSLLVVFGIFIQQQQMVVGRLHGVDPERITHLEMLAYLFARETHHVQLVFVLVQLEHIADIDIAFVDLCVKQQWCVEGYVCAGNLQLQIEYQVIEGT